ncbi:MAG: family 78 glycoside hydrolase catalytic domain [Spirochaetes bacterium]|nr:family 78 glycoside hydrolase catalytic domain [Spirochaetota bacterium]
MTQNEHPTTEHRQWTARWIRDAAFSDCMPIDVFHKQLTPKTLPEHRADLKNRRMFVRRTFVVENIDKPYIDISADDYCKLYVNGTFVSQGPAPAYHFNYRYNRIDLSGVLKPGENVIAVDVYYQGCINRVWQSGDYRQGLIAEIVNGGTCILKTDASWKYIVPAHSSGTTVGYETQYLENIDERQFPIGWTAPGFDDSAWLSADENLNDDHTLSLQETPQLAIYELKPAVVKERSAGHFFIDFGHEITGQFTLNAFGESGDTIEIRHGEELDAAGNVRFAMRCNCAYQETWTLAGRAPDRLQYYDYKAFRYVEIIASNPRIRMEDFAATVRHYPFDEKNCAFKSSSELLNGIFRICANGVRYGSQELFLDCPSREKGQYLGDLTVTAHAHLYLSGGDGRLFKKALHDFADSMTICSGLMAVAPGSFMQEIADYSLQYPLQLLTYYRHTGDRALLETLFPKAEAALGYFKKYERADGLIENVADKWNLVDWPENLRDGYDFNLDPKGAGSGPHAVLNAFYVSAHRAMNEIRHALGIRPTNDDVRTASAFIDAFYRYDKKCFVDSTVSSHASLHANALALFIGLVPAEAVESVIKLVRTKRFSCGVYMSYFVLKGLARYGEYELIYDLLTGNDEHSWGTMLAENATACFEAWGKDQKWNTSLCHPWASSPIPLLIEDIIGLSPAAPGWTTVLFSPHLPENPPDFRLSLNVPSAVIVVERTSDDFSITVRAGHAPVTLITNGIEFEDGSTSAIIPAGERMTLTIEPEERYRR